MSLKASGDMPQPQTLGKKFGFWSVVGILLCCSGAWEGLVASLAQSLLSGSAVSLVWGWVFVSVGMVFLSASLAEMASRWPTAGGQYHWAAELAPPKLKNVLSWFTCCMAIAALTLGGISCAMGVAVQVQSYVALSIPTYEPLRWHAFLIVVLQNIIFLAVNALYAKGLHVMNLAMIVIHITGFIAVIVTLLVCTKDKHDAAFVFTHFENSGGWQSDGVAWSVGLLTSVFAFFSLDAACHYSEEVDNAQVVIPRGMMIQVAANALMTFPFIITLLFCIGDVFGVLSSPIGLMSPFTQIVYNSTNSVPAAIILNVIASTVAFGAGLDLYGAAGRMIWTLARDKALPPWVAQINERFDVPINALYVLQIPATIVPMIYIWNSTAFYGIMAGVLVFFQISYLIPIVLNITYGRWSAKHVKPAWSLGKFGMAIDICSAIFSIYVILFMSFPVYMPLSAVTMNYACAIVGGAILISAIGWFAYARTRYNGPIYSNMMLAIIDGHAREDSETGTVDEKHETFAKADVAGSPGATII